MVEIRGLNLGSLENASGDEDSRDLLKFVSDNEEEWPSLLLERSELKRLLAESISRMPGVEKTVLSRTNAIVTNADDSDWVGVRRELDGALSDVKNAMIELRDDQLAHLVSLGGWLRGTEVLTSIVGKSYTPDGADLLNQPDLLKYFQERLAGMPQRLRNNQLVGKIQKSLNEISPLISQKITPASIKRIHEITSDMVKAINSNA